MSATIRRIRHLPPGLDRLVTLADAEDFGAVARLRQEWRSGENRFDKAGECLFAALVNTSPGTAAGLVGICGLNRDPFAAADTRTGRVRRLYVDPAHRRMGIAAALVSAVHREAVGVFDVLQLRTLDAGADAFYVARGFTRVTDDANVTHRLRL